jgi:hypothetical protein
MVRIESDDLFMKVFKTRGLDSIYNMEVTVLMNAMDRVGLAVASDHGQLVVLDTEDPESVFPASLKDVIAMTTERLKAEKPDANIKKWKFLLELTLSKCSGEKKNGTMDLPELYEPDEEPTSSVEPDDDSSSGLYEEAGQSAEDESSKTQAENGNSAEDDADEFNFSYRKGHHLGGSGDGLDLEKDQEPDEGEDEFEVDSDIDQTDLSGWSNLFGDQDNESGTEEAQPIAAGQTPEPERNEKPAHHKSGKQSWMSKVFGRNAKNKREEEMESCDQEEDKAEDKPIASATAESNSARTDLKLGTEYDSDTANESFDMGFDQNDPEIDTHAEPNSESSDDDENPASTSEPETEQQEPDTADSSGDPDDGEEESDGQDSRSAEKGAEPKYYNITVVETYTKTYVVRASNQSTAISAVNGLWRRENKKNGQNGSGILSKKDFEDMSIIAERTDAPE